MREEKRVAATPETPGGAGKLSGMPAKTLRVNGKKPKKALMAKAAANGSEPNGRGGKAAGGGKSSDNKSSDKGSSFKAGDKVVYPAHGVGVIIAVKKDKVDGQSIRLFVIRFEKDRLTLRLPVDGAAAAGLRNTAANLDSVLRTLKKPRRVRRAMWSRRAQEYESKINSGDPVYIAEVVRDLYRKPEQNEQSYSERLIYQEALERLACEFAVVKGIAQPIAARELEDILLTA